MTGEELFRMWSAKPTKKSVVKATEKTVKKSKEVSVKKAEPKKSAEKPKKQTVKKQEKKSEQKIPAKVEGQNFMSAVKHIQKSAEKRGLAENAGTFSKGNFLYLTDNCRILKSRFKFITAGENPKAFDVDNFFAQVHNRKGEKTANCPTIPELKKLIENAKAEYCKGMTDKEIAKAKRKGELKRVLYRFEDGLTVNADFLMDAIHLTGSTEFKYIAKDKKSPLIFKSSDGNYEMALLPVYSTDKKFKGNCKVA